jgi:hypothetical protein
MAANSFDQYSISDIMNKMDLCIFNLDLNLLEQFSVRRRIEQAHVASLMEAFLLNGGARKDSPLVVVPATPLPPELEELLKTRPTDVSIPSDMKFQILAGNHRWEAAKALLLSPQARPLQYSVDIHKWPCKIMPYGEH